MDSNSLIIKIMYKTTTISILVLFTFKYFVNKVEHKFHNFYYILTSKIKYVFFILNLPKKRVYLLVLLPTNQFPFPPKTSNRGSKAITP